MQFSFKICAIYLVVQQATVLGRTDEILAVKNIDEKVLWSLSPECSRTLANISAHLNNSLSPLTALKAFLKTYGQGKSNEFITDSRFQFRMQLCFKLAGESQFSPSEIPTVFCYRYDPKQYRSIAQTICFPASCLKEEHKFWYIYEKVLGSDLVENNNLLSTCIRSRRHKQWTVKQQIFLAFSLKESIGVLFKMPKNRSKVITYYVKFKPYIDNVDEYHHDIADNFTNLWIANFLLSVDVFLVLGGTVNAYGFFQKYGKMKTKPTWTSLKFWLNFYLHRVIRLWPTYCYTLVSIYFITSAFYGEIWPEIDHTIQCSKYWWQNILFIGSLFEHRCMTWAWYISTEFIFYLLSPIFLLILGRSQKQGYLLSVFCIALSDASRVYVMIAHNMPPTQLGWNTPPIFNSNFIEHFAIMYIKPQYRIAPYIVGLLLGYQLAKIQERKHYHLKHSLTFVACGWALAILLAFMAIYGLYPILINLNWKLYYLIYGALHRTAFAIAVAWLIYACHCGYGGLVNTVLSFKLFLPLSMLCYSVYLNHLPMIFASYLYMEFPFHYVSKFPLLLLALFSLFISYLLGFQASMIVEFPICNIERSIQNRWKGKHKMTGEA
uniref:Acyltransferase 3 domain-containing protein n=1 Tax=Setaria digitata TaxID=48799 RepID=A0A915PH94_9BILA